MFFTTNPTLNRLLWLCLSFYLLLLAIITLDTWQAPAHFWTAWSLQSLPLLLLLPGLLQKHYRSYSWLCFLLLLYFISYVVQVYASNRNGYDIAGLLVIVGLFITAMFSSRQLQRYHLR